MRGNVKHAQSALITFGITCYNAADSIKKAVLSVINQSWDNYEIIVVDDASGDDSIQLIKSLQYEYPGLIKLIRHEVNLGYPSALNTIIDNASGEYIAFFDDDDEYQQSRIQEQYVRLKNFERNHGARHIVCYCDRRVFINGEEKAGAYVKAIGNHEPEPYGESVADFILWHKKEKPYSWGEFGSGTLMASKATLSEFMFDPAFRRSAEWDFAVRVAISGGYFISVPKPLVKQNKTFTKDKSGEKPLRYSLMLRNKHKRFLKNKNVYLASVCQAYARFYYFRNMRYKSSFFYLCACLSSPIKILLPSLIKKLQ